MIAADSITCRIPTEYAVKLNELFCTVAHPVDSADSQTWAAWVTALGTLVLAAFAIFAWTNSRKTLVHMREQMRVTESRAALERQLPPLIAFITSAREMLSATYELDSDWDSASRRVDAAWTNWSVNIVAEDQEFRRTAGLVFFHLRKKARKVWRWRKMWDLYERQQISNDTISRMFPDFVAMDEMQEDLAVQVNNYVLSLQNWQTSDSDRPKELARMKRMLSLFE